MPRVSVLLSSLNHGKFVAEAIQSVLDQTFTDFELIVIDDCSDDDSWDIIQSFCDTRIRAFRNAERRRGAAGLNDAIRDLVKGEYVAIHHSDDVYMVEKLEKQVAFLDAHAEVGAAFSHVKLISEEGHPFTDSNHFYYDLFHQPNRNRFQWLNHFFYQGNCLCHPSALVRKHCYNETGLYDRRLGQLTDLDLWVRICLKFDIHILQEPLVGFRVRANEANQSGSRPETLVRCQTELQQILRHYLTLSSAEDFSQVFPSVATKLLPKESQFPFLVAMEAIDSNLGPQQAFGISILYDMMKYPATVLELERIHGFRYIDLIRLTGSCDIFRFKENLALQAARDQLKQELERVTSSRSWRLTKPFRLFTKLLGGR